MDLSKPLHDFARDFQQQIIVDSDMDGEESFREDQFTQAMIDYLGESGEIDDATVCSHRARGMQVNGYNFSSDGECLDLLVSAYTASVPPVSVPKADVETALKRLRTFLQKALDGYHFSLEEASPAFDLSLQIAESKESMTRIRLFLLTDGIVKADNISDVNLNGFRISHHIWDIERLYRCFTSGKKREEVEIDFEREFGQLIPCLATTDSTPEYTTYLAVMPGTLLAGLYGQYGPRLLERNVRSFLQARGKVNSGIRNTILKEPQMFLAYNNGISVTAEAVQVVTLDGGGQAIKWARDFQVVNGGQTTASIYHAAVKDKADVSVISVQVKLTVISDAGRVDEIVPRISEYANSQNKIQTADFSANDPFHRRIEELSRTIWAPAKEGSQRMTRWYYERARGQYLDAKGRERTPARTKAFELTHPTSQKFTKTDLSKFENTWNQLPHIVSRGAQKNFNEFTLLLAKRGTFTPDLRYFERLVAKAILFQRTERLVSAQSFGGYRANIVAYTLAWLSHATQQRIDLDRIWREQALTPALEDAISEIARHAHHHITSSSGNANVTEWCKKEKCWEEFRAKGIPLKPDLDPELIAVGPGTSSAVDRGIESFDESDMLNVARVVAVGSETWGLIAAWAKETNNLQAWQRSLAYSLSKIIFSGREISRKQATQGVRILEEAERLGFEL